MRLHLLALNPTDSVTLGFLPAAARLGLDVTLLTDQPVAHRRACERSVADGGRLPELSVLGCDVTDFREVVARISALGPAARPDAVLTNSDHLQPQAALAAAYFGLPGKDWRAALDTKNKALLRRRLAEAGADAGADPVRSVELSPVDEPEDLPGRLKEADLPYPCVVKPREGVASEDVTLAEDAAALVRHCHAIRARRPGASLVVEEYLEGELHTLETLGDGSTLHVLGSFRTRLSPPPHFIEERLDLLPEPPQPHTEQVLAQLRALGVGFGACHTEYVTQGDRARLIEVNYRAIGDQCDIALADVLGVPLFEHVLRTHLGEPLPADLGARSGGRLRVEYVCADRGGTLEKAPPASDIERDGVRLVYRPLRAPGEAHPLHGTNRDYVGVIRATGTDQGRIDQAVEAFLAAQRWEIVS
ncbi:siderophore biosynthesis protein [Streptosporangium nondiastaticum]|uniref:Siderophore biosynthesis protein n=1 Tax=Streptosporangium nondiastaticum TaxID=35764 RepID=A0A9X7JL46_9ACTN|nr:ATP-grasp domain-containing protein [Streptosporangium nondiastaticum]PSJ25680.1 siderophore biosynthesis protein [Streptosporangium nondiastaticum]